MQTKTIAAEHNLVDYVKHLLKHSDKYDVGKHNESMQKLSPTVAITRFLMDWHLTNRNDSDQKNTNFSTPVLSYITTRWAGGHDKEELSYTDRKDSLT